MESASQQQTCLSCMACCKVLHIPTQQTCLSCMACCKVLHIPTLFKPTDYMIHFYKIRGHTVLVADGVMYLELDEPCPMLTQFGCKIYDGRPYTCRVSFGYQSAIESVRSACRLKGGE